MLKRLESSWRAFEVTIENLLLKMAVWLERYSPERFEMWAGNNPRWWSVVQTHIRERLQEDGILQGQSREARILQDDSLQYKIPLENLQSHVVSNPSEEEDDIASVEIEQEFIPDDHDLASLFGDVVDDMNFLTGLLGRIYRRFYADELASDPDTQKDDKFKQLLDLLKNTQTRSYSFLPNFAIPLDTSIPNCRILGSDRLLKLIAAAK